MWFYTAFITSVISAIAVIVSKKLIAGVSASVLTWATLVLATPIIFSLPFERVYRNLTTYFSWV